MSDQSAPAEKPETTGAAPEMVPCQHPVSDALVSVVHKTHETMLRLNRSVGAIK